MRIARSTPAQKPRGDANCTVIGGFAGGMFVTSAFILAAFPDYADATRMGLTTSTLTHKKRCAMGGERLREAALTKGRRRDRPWVTLGPAQGDFMFKYKGSSR